MNESAEPTGPYRTCVAGTTTCRRSWNRRQRCHLTEGAVRPMTIGVTDELIECGLEMTSIDDQHPVQPLPTDGAHEAFGEGIGPRRPDRRANDSDAFGAEHLVEAGREFGVAVPDEELRRWIPLGSSVGQVPGLPGDRGPTRMCRHSCKKSFRVSVSMKKWT